MRAERKPSTTRALRARKALGLAMLVGASASVAHDTRGAAIEASLDVSLPSDHSLSAMSLSEAIARRRSLRDLSVTPLSLEELSQLLWAAQGVTDPERGLRAAPSAGALYPLRVYVAKVDGAYEYEPRAHAIHRFEARDVRGALAAAAHHQLVVMEAPVLLVIAGDVSRTRAKYGSRAERYVTLEAGHAAENILLAATALGLGAVPVGAFNDDGVRAALRLDDDLTPLYLVPVGHPAIGRQ